MEDNILILPTNPETFAVQSYSQEDVNIIPSFEFDTAFSQSTDYIEYYVYDENQNLIFPPVTQELITYSVKEGNVTLDPIQDLQRQQFDEGNYYINYHFYRKHLGSSVQEKYYISEISSDRTEIRLASSLIDNDTIISSSNEFIEYRELQDYFVDFYLNFGSNNLAIANNIKLDTLIDDNPTVLIKLYEPLPGNIDLKAQCWVVENISEAQGYQVRFPIPVFEPQDFTFIAGPNYSLNIKDESGTDSEVVTYDTLIGSNITSSQQQINSLLNEKGLKINVNYEDRSQYIKFSSALTRLENFYYKVGLIESYQNEIASLSTNITGSTTGSVAFSSSKASYQGKIDDIITNLDSYEYFLYYNSGSQYSYPKSTSTKPYTLSSTGSAAVLNWLGSADPANAYYGGQALSASNYDQENQDWLYWAIPEYLRDDPENQKYELFVDMIGQHFDNIWVYSKDVVNKFNADNRLDYGISKDLVADAIRDFGVKLYSNNFNTNDLYEAFLGITPSGSYFPATGSEYIDTMISASNDAIPLDDANKRLYKRIYHNIPYLLKTKGTVAGLRALITSYGIPDTILRVNEFGDQALNTTQNWELEQNTFNYALNVNGNDAFSSSFNPNPIWGLNSPKTVQFRFKTPGVPTGSFEQLLWTGETNQATLTISYTGSSQTSGSYSGSIADPQNKYGTITFYPKGIVPNAETASVYLPVFDNNWWSVMTTVNYTNNTASLFVANSDGNQIGFQASDTTPTTSSLYRTVDTIHFPGKTEFSSYKFFSGSYQEIRYWDIVISQSSFDNFVLNPYSIIGNSLNSTPGELIFRAPLGSMLDTESRTSIHPVVTGSYSTSSFASDSNFYISTASFIDNKELAYINQAAIGIKNRITDKITLENNIIPSGNTLSPLQSIEQKSYTTQNYTPNTNYLEVATSPSDQIDNDIIAQLGNFNIGDYIGDPRQVSESRYNYPDLDNLRDTYFEKYTKSYEVKDFIRLIKYLDNSLFKMIKDFTPARTSLSSGVVVKQHMLERNKLRSTNVSWEDEQYTGSLRPFVQDYNTGSIYAFSGGPGGMLNQFNSIDFHPSGADGTGADNRFGIQQAWNETIQTVSGSTTYIIDDQREFYNGEYSGSEVTLKLQRGLDSDDNPCRGSFTWNNVPDYLYRTIAYYSASTSEAAFLNSSFYPSSPGYIWLWNDGYKVKHIKINNTSINGDTLSEFIQDAEWVRLSLDNPVNAAGNTLYSGTGSYTENYQIANVTQYTSLGYNYLLIDQANTLTSFAVNQSGTSTIENTFSASGDYIIYASSGSDDLIEPVKSLDVDSSIPQGYFPSSSTGYPTEQFFRGWAGATYYVDGTLVTTTGELNDSLNAFNSGSTERDNDSITSNYAPSSLSFFIDATASYKEINSASFVDHADQTNLTQIGPTILTLDGQKLKYYYKEDTGQIITSGSSLLRIPKSSSQDFNTSYNVELVSATESPQTYSTIEGFDIELQVSQSLWLTRGLATPGTEDGNYWKYNRYLHRPFKAYVVTSTGSVAGGYGAALYATDEYGAGVLGSIVSPITEIENIYIAYSSSEASNRSNDGVYTFTSGIVEDLAITASVSLSYTSSAGTIYTWETASLKLYQNDSVLVTQSVYITPTNILSGLTSSITTTLNTASVAVDDTLKLSLEVQNEASGFNSSLLVTSYTMSFGNLKNSFSDLAPVFFSNYLAYDNDCDPLANNIIGDRPNQRLQDVDYSVDISSPINFGQIITDSAVRAAVPESNYTQIGFSNPRYIGSSTSRRQINEFNIFDTIDSTNQFYYPGDISNPSLVNKGKGPKLGKIPNIELKNSYIAYFNKIEDPYPTLNNKTAYYVKYLIDETGTIFDPTLSDINFSIFEKTFQVYDYDLKPTRVKASLQNIEEAKELSKLNEGISNTFKLGKYPTPILYTQNSSLTHVNNIKLSGSAFYGTLGLDAAFTNYGININATQSTADFPQPVSQTDFQNFTPSSALRTASFASSDLTLFESNTDPNIPTGSVANTILMPLDPNASIPNTSGSNLSDPGYELLGSFEFFTSTIPGRYRQPNGKSDDWHDGDLFINSQPVTSYRQMLNMSLYPYQKPSILETEVYVADTQDFEISSVTLTIIENPGKSDEQIYKTLNIEERPDGFSNQWKLNSGFGLNYFSFTPDSRYLEKIIIQQITNKSDWSSNRENRIAAEVLIGGGWAEDGADIYGIQNTQVIYKWGINFKRKNLKQFSGFYLQAKGTVTQPGDTGRNDDFFVDYDSGGSRERDRKWTRTFNPTVTGYSTEPILNYTITSPLISGDQNANGAPGPYWRRVSGTTDMLYMSSSILNQAYGIFDENGNNTNGQYYVQAKLDYTPNSSPDFPSTIEPSFAEFDPISDPWSLQVGDEIRFQNNENLVYTITSTNGRQAIEPPTDPYSINPETDGLRIVVSPPFEYTGSDSRIITNEPTNLDFFVVRRYKENRNFIILDQQKPYGFPVSASTSPGILLPEHRIEKYDRNPDEVLKDLIEKRII